MQNLGLYNNMHFYHFFTKFQYFGQNLEAFSSLFLALSSFLVIFPLPSLDFFSREKTECIIDYTLLSDITNWRTRI